MSMLVLKRGLMDTIQDNGRYGYQHAGVNPGGSMDLFAANVANILVGNFRNEPVIELHFPASVFLFKKDCVIAITGADFEPEVDSKPVPINTSIVVAKNATLKFKKYKKGARSYLAIHGEWNIEPWLNSYSTNTKAMAGGYKGRALRENDVIEVQRSKPTVKTSSTTVVLPASVNQLNISIADNVIRCVKGSEYNCLSEASKTHLETNPFIINLQSDRMGYRLQGNNLTSDVNQQLLSTAVTRGTIQLLPSGQLVVLMADHQTTGGYPKVAHVISADLPMLAQMRPNEEVRFKLVELKEAEDAYIGQQQYLQNLQETIQLQLKQFLA
ncbi:MAG TPA: biotin-dependent carboxyltransferase family protein [Segetibacter sp.]